MSNSVGKRLLIACKSNGWTQTWLAEQLNVSIRTIQNWQQDVSSPPASALQKIEELGASSKYILFGQGSPLSGDASKNDDPRVSEVVSLLKTLGPGHIDDVIEFVRLHAQLDNSEKKVQKRVTTNTTSNFTSRPGFGRSSHLAHAG